MKSDAVINELGAENLANFVSSSPVGEKSASLEMFNKAFKDAGGDPDAIFANTSYDAAFMLALALEKTGGKKEGVGAALIEIANGEGEAIQPGEWKKAKELIAAGKAIDYKGAAGEHDFDPNGDVPGTYALFEVGADGFEVVTQMN